jgi:hypothetical protein
MNFRATAIFLAAGWMIGCTVGPNYHRPTVQAPPAFRAPDPLPAPQAESLADLKWREVFKDADLKQLVKTALSRRITTCGMRSSEWRRRGPIRGSSDPINSRKWAQAELFS